MYLIITASPNKEGLTALCGKAAVDGIKKEGGPVEIIDLCESKIQPCLVCCTAGPCSGWGPCYGTAKCVIDDILTDIREKFRVAKGVTLITPVYFGQPSERMKYFLDRFRRNEVFNEKNGSAAKDVPIDLIAVAGGSGNGTVPCLNEMELWCRQVGALMKERFGITKYNSDFMLSAVEDSARRLVTGEFFGVRLTT